MEKLRISNRDIISSIAGNIYEMHPMSIKPFNEWTPEEKKKYK